MTIRNTLDKYWKSVEVAPVGIVLQVQVTNAAGDLYVLPFPCRLTAAGWVNAVSGTALVVKPTYWKLHVETLPSKRAWMRRSTATRPKCGVYGTASHEHPCATKTGLNTSVQRSAVWKPCALPLVIGAWSATTRMRATPGA
jgi:hypothetical protein